MAVRAVSVAATYRSPAFPSSCREAARGFQPEDADAAARRLPLFAVTVDTEVFGDASRQPLSMLRRGDVLSDGPQPEHGVLRHVFGSHAVGATAPADVQGCLPQLGNQ